MFLRSIQIRGFKSFADKTILEFIPGVSVIVGPNGSGKSNLVDAISWVLGEQGARALRGGHMADVIFAGTPSRPALGMAEVKLVIDNAAGKIPVPMSEIEISRTIFRSGESEYRIGGQVVRLLDILELLSESGIGRALHTVVGQGQLEEVLLARPEERRKYIEEAAGIAKHRRRKERAERKLEGLEHDVLRLQDVLGELRRQLKPLQQQAEMAKKHERLTEEARELSRKVAAARLRALLRERERRREGWDEGLERRKGARERLDALDGEVLAAADARATTTGALADAEESFRSASLDREGADRSYREAVEREVEARERLASQSARTARLDAVGLELKRIEDALSEVVSELEVRERELTDAEASFREAEERRRQIEEVRRAVGEEAAGRRAELEALRRSLAASDRERERLEGAIGSVRSKIADLEAEREALEAEIEQFDAQSSPLSDRRSQLERDRRQLVERIEGSEDVIRRHEARRDLLEARRRDIEETPGTAFMKGKRGRAVGLLKDLVRVAPELERALEAALGHLGDAVVYDDGERALADAPEGDGAILAIAAGGPVPLGLSGERRLLSMVQAEPVARGIVSTILRDIYLAASVDDAAERQAQHPGTSFVTPEGIVIGPGVIHTARKVDDRAREIRAEIAVLDHDLAAARNALKPRRERLDELVQEVAFLQEQIEAADAEITTAAERMSVLERELVGLRTEEALLSERLASIDDTVLGWRERLAAEPPAAEEPPELPPLPQAPIQARVAVETLRRERATLDARLHALRTEREGLAEDDPVRLREELAEAELARTRAQEDVRRADEAFRAESATREARSADEREAAETEAGVNRAWREASMALDRLREEYEDDDRHRGDIERRIKEGERLIREGHGADPDELLGVLTDDDSVDGLEKRAELVQRRLALLGRVNLLATGELESMQERNDFMQRELDDVRKARRDLLELIAQVDREITETFEGAFRDVATQFERLVGELFPGGEGRLVLTDPTSPLEAGIEIEASPGRKRVKRISLLSGGERSLAALAFLFAIFTARPSPFYLMDEVEPALDDLNLHRFLRLVEGFAADAQVLIVTHQKRTMEIAGMMYGVSLNKDGTTRIVCQRTEQSDDREATRIVLQDVPAGEPVG